MKQFIFLAFFVMQSFGGLCLAQESLVGTWNGDLKVQGISLRIVFHFEEKGGILNTTLDSPDQGAKNIPTESTVLTDKTLTVLMPLLQAKFKGDIIDNSTIDGVFTQGGVDVPLSLKKEIKESNSQPENSKQGKDAYTSTDIQFENVAAKIKLAGTITYPKGQTKCPAVILVTGSGPQDRDETILEQKPFLRIAEFLSSNGIAVLRYDDRGIAQSEGNFAQSTTFDFLNDAMAAFNYLSNYEGIDNNKIGIVGHSEGAMIAAMAASENPAIAFIAMLGGTALPFDSLMILQTTGISKAMGVSQEQIEKNTILNSGIYSIIKNELDDVKAKEKITNLINAADFIPADQKEAVIHSAKSTMLSPWMRVCFTLDPEKYFADIKCPVLAVYGGKDLQVPAQENSMALKKMASAKNKTNYTILTIPGVNHLFQNAKTGLMNEYSDQNEAVMNDETLNLLQGWLVKQ